MRGRSESWELLDGLHTLCRGSSGTCPSCTEVECSEILEQTLEELANSIEDAGATVTVEPLPTIRGYLLVLGRLFENLLDNAIKFRRTDDRPQIHVWAEEGARKDGVSRSADNGGIGIDPGRA